MKKQESDLAKSVDKLKPPVTPEERRAQIGIALSAVIVVLIYVSVIFLMKGCAHGNG